jgi:hypothetical protein
MSDTSAFDFEAFIRGTQLPRRTVFAYRLDHRDEIARLTAEHDALPADGDDRESTGTSPRAGIASQIKALRDEMEASKVEFVIRTLTPQEFKRVQEDDTLDVYDQLEMQSVEPHLTKDQWQQVGEAIGAGQWGAMVSAANDLVLKRVAVPDFSRSVSQTLSPQGSSAS